MGSLKVFFRELRHVRVHAAGAELHSDRAHCNGTFLHCTLQELRVMGDFCLSDLKRHKSVQDSLLEYVYETYQPRDSIDVTPRVKALKTKVEAHITTIGQQWGKINCLNGSGGSACGADGNGTP